MAKLLYSGVTEQLGALSNLAMQGPPEAADRSTKVCQISNIKANFLSAKSKPASMEYEAVILMLAKRATFGECLENILNHAL